MARRRTASVVNPVEKRELELFVNNDSGFYQQKKRAELALAKVICRKKGFSVDLGARLYERILVDGAKKYSREHSIGTDGLTMFSAATRRELAKEYAQDFKDRANKFMKTGQQDISDGAAAALKSCSAKPLAGLRRRR